MPHSTFIDSINGGFTFETSNLPFWQLNRRTLTPNDNWALRCAYEFLFQHEYFHFQAEIAVSRYELLLFQNSIYLEHVYSHHFMDRSASWIEESLANAKAYQNLGRQNQPIASQSAIDQFKSFLATWMKRQPPGYRDYDQWKGRMGVTNGEAAIKEHLHQSLEHWRLNYGIKGHWRRSKTHNYIDVLDLFRNAEYSKIPVTRIPDARLPGLGSVREFPKAYGLQVSVFSNDHPPPHVHVDFLDGKPKI